MTASASTTIGAVAHDIIAKLAPDELAFFDVVGAGFFADTAARNRAVHDVLSGQAREDPIGFDIAAGLQFITTVVLTILNGVACEILTDQATGLAKRWRRNRRLSREIAADGLGTPIPQMNSLDAAAVGELARQIALGSGIDAESSQRIGTFVSAALTAPPA
jgi:hypothetical protein